MGKFEKIKLS